MKAATTTKSRIASLLSSAGAFLGACGGICGSACLTGACCGSAALPVLASIGLSGSAYVFFEKLKPLFLAATIAGLGYAFYKAYKPVPAVVSGTDCCAPGSCCAPEKGTFIRSKAFLWGITVLCAAMWLYPYIADAIRSPGYSCSTPCGGDSPGE